MGRTVYSSSLIFYLERSCLTDNVIFFFLSCQSKYRLEMTSSCLRELYNNSLILWHSAVHIVETESDEHLPIINRTADLPDPQGVTRVLHICLALLPQQWPAETTGKEDKTLFRPRNAFLHSALAHHIKKKTLGTELSSPSGSSLSATMVLWVLQLCFFHDFWVRQISKLYVLPAAVAMLCNTAAMTPSDHSWHISLS